VTSQPEPMPFALITRAPPPSNLAVELIFQRMVSSLPLEKLWEGKSRLRKVRDFQKKKDSAERIWL
jgi:hypothetical protein